MPWNRPRKYKNTKIEVDGIMFDSKKEAERFRELKAMEEAGEIHGLAMQQKFVLIPTQREPEIVGMRGGIKKGKVIEKECAYIADFVYYAGPNVKQLELVVEDTKGYKTKDYIIKRKLMLYFYGIRIHEI